MKRRIGRVLLALLILLVGAEVVVRMAIGSPPGHPAPQVPLMHHVTRGFTMPPSFTGYSLEAPVTLNERGFRTDMPQEAARFKHRIVAVGDSIVFGQGVARDRTFCELASSPGARVVNLGVPGYDLLQAVTVLQEAGRFYFPLEAQLHVGPNDLLPNREPETFRHLDGTPKPDPHPWLRRSALAVWLGRGWKSSRDPHHPFKRILLDDDPEGFKPEWAETRTAVLGPIRFFREMCDRLKVRPLVVIHPAPFQAKPTARWNHMVKDWCNRLQVNCLDITEQLDESCWIPLDGHYNDEGHRRVASALREHLYGISE